MGLFQFPPIINKIEKKKKGIEFSLKTK
jgi:hypothetical protein